MILPIAPRPINGELLSSWQGRVACRYGLSDDELAVLIGAGPDRGRVARFADRDFAPSAEAIAAWARACRVDEDALRALVLSGRSRPLGWHVWGEATQARSVQRPICVACLDEDAEAGGDHHLRSDWALVERVTCSGHSRVLSETCPYCLTSLGWRFSACDQAARLVCVRCDRVVCGGSSSDATVSSPFPRAMDNLARSFRGAIDTRPAEADRMMRVTRLLWASPKIRGGSRAPCITKMVSEVRLPPSVEARVDRDEPLATLPLGWRMMTLIAVAQLLDLADTRREFGPPPVSLERIIEWAAGSSPERPAARTVTPSSKPHSDWVQLRSLADYRTMAEAILASEEWRAVQAGNPRQKSRTLGRLMERALDLPRRPSSGASCV